MKARLALILVWACVFATGPGLAQSTASFAGFLARFETKAVAAGIDRGLYRKLTGGLTPDPGVPNLVAAQPEFTTPIWDYLDKRVSANRIAQGRAAVARNRRLFDTIGARFGVDPFVLAAIWGVESDYGAILGNTRLIRPVVRALATLAFEQRGRVAEDEAELIAAMRLIQDKGWTAQTLVGSWAGAIGHTQIIVSGLLAYGTDGDGDGKVDPQRSLADALATTAVYLKDLGYVSGSDWGYEVNVPDGFDYILASREDLRPVTFFAERGVKRVAGRVFADPAQPVFLYLPAGQNGPKFLMTGNYLVLKGYNFSDSYALSVALLADRLKGGGGLHAAWPTTTRFADLAQRLSIQTELKRLGYYDGAVDGRIGPVTQRAYQFFQKAHGLVADGFITADSYQLLRGAKG